MNKPLPPLIAALLDPARYPDPAAKVELIETHASWLLLAGDFAYKIKKPVILPFLDYGTLARRQACCEAEVRLNRRYSPLLYLAVIAIVGPAENPGIDSTGTAIEFAVKMRRFSESGRLDRLCRRGQLRAQQISELAATVAAFHERAAVAAPTSRFGEAAQVLQPVRENFDELPGLLGEGVPPARVARLAEWTLAESTRLQPHFAARKAAGRIRECHGDLHLANLVLIDEQITLFDCIEFSEDLRWIDVASEIAFTYVDLLDHGQPGLACWLVNEWLACSGDYDAVRVLRFYAVYRALVRAKVAAIRANQTGVGPAAAIRYLTLAERLIAPPPARLIITHGVAGCGKSRASRLLLLRDPAAATLRLRSDVERKRLFGLLPNAASGSATDSGIYSGKAGELTYERLRELTSMLLAAGWSVIVDAAFLERSRRDAFRALAREAAVDFFIIAPQAKPKQLHARIRGRLAKGRDASEATLAVLERQLAHIEALGAEEIEHVVPPRELPR